MKVDNLQEPVTIGQQIKQRLVELTRTDGLKRTQRWLASRVGLGEVALSNKISGNEKFLDDEIKEINKHLETDFKI